MKKIVVLGLSLVVLMCVIVGCGSKEVSSGDEANRLLLTENANIAECEKKLSEYEKNMNILTEKKLNAIEKDLKNCYNGIIACDLYKDTEIVKPKYDKAMDFYNRAVKHLEQVRVKLQQQEEAKE